MSGIKTGTHIVFYPRFFGNFSIFPFADGHAYALACLRGVEIISHAHHPPLRPRPAFSHPAALLDMVHSHFRLPVCSRSCGPLYFAVPLHSPPATVARLRFSP